VGAPATFWLMKPAPHVELDGSVRRDDVNVGEPVLGSVVGYGRGDRLYN
jgi:hypothetical protein